MPVEEKPVCWTCETPLTYPYYWLKWEEGTKFGCRKCVEAKSTKEGRHYAYENNSILLLDKSVSIGKKKVGSNLQPNDIGKVDSGNQFMCNICSYCPTNVGEARYICLGCNNDPNLKGDHDDICEKCLETTVQNDPKIIESLTPSHDKSHPLLRVLYNVKGYYEY